MPVGQHGTVGFPGGQHGSAHWWRWYAGGGVPVETPSAGWPPVPQDSCCPTIFWPSQASYPLVNSHIWKITIFNGKSHYNYNWWFSIAMLVYQRVVFFFIFDKQNLCHICHDHLVYSGDMSSIAGIERNHGSRSLLHHWNVSLIARFSSAFSSDVPHKNLFHFSFTGATGCFSPLSCAARCIDRFQWYFAQRHHVSRDQPLHGCLGLEGLVEPPGCLKKNMGNSHGNSPWKLIAWKIMPDSSMLLQMFCRILQ